MDYQALRNELDIDPATLGYPAAPVDWFDESNAAACVAILNNPNRTVDVETLSASELFEAIDSTEWNGRSADQKDNIRLVLGLGDNIQIAPGTKARAILANALTGATNSLANLSALGSKNVTRAEELGLGSTVTVGDVQNARKLP